MWLMWCMWGCSEEVGPGSVAGSGEVVAACTYRDVWLDLGANEAREEVRGFDEDGRPIWHTVDGTLTTTWGYDHEGHPQTMLRGDDALDPLEQHAYVFDVDGLLEHVYLGDGRWVDFLYGGDDELIRRIVTSSDGRVTEATAWSYWGEGNVDWEVVVDGRPVLRSSGAPYDEAYSFLERQDDLQTGDWIEVLERTEPDGTPALRHVRSDSGSWVHTWIDEGASWLLQAQWSSLGGETELHWTDQVRYRFDERGREVSRTFGGQGASPYRSRERAWDCDVDVEEPYEPPLWTRPSVDYVVPLYVDPPPLR